MLQHDLSQAARLSWRVSLAGELCGPLDEEGLRSLAKAGRLSRFSVVQQVGTPQWRLLASVSELAALFPDLPASSALMSRRAPLSRAERLAALAIVLLVGTYWAWWSGWLGSALFRPRAGTSTSAPVLHTNSPELAAQATKALSEGRWAAGLDASRQYLAVTSDPATAVTAQKRAWAESILDQLAKDSRRASAETLPLLKTSLDWEPANAKRVAERSLIFARDALSTGSLHVVDAEAYFDFALGIESDHTPTSVTQIAWAALSSRLTDLPALGRENFERLIARCVVDDLPETVTAHPAWLLAHALHAQAQGEWNQAAPLLREVAEMTADPALAEVAKKILAPPEPGRREFKRTPIVFRTPAKRPALRIELVAAEVTGKEIVLELRLTNTAVRRQKLAYMSAEGGRTVPNNPLCLIDEHGQAVAAPMGFGEAGRLVTGQGGLRVIELARWESVKLVARFPMIEPGASRVRFVSPRLPNQSEWGWTDLALKAGPFEPPLTTAPLSDIAPSKPEEATPVTGATSGAETAPAAVTPTATPKPQSSRTTAGSTRKTKAAPRPSPTPERAEAPVPTPEASRSAAAQDDKTASIQNTPTPTPQKTRSTTTDRNKAQADALRRDAQQARARCQPKLRSLAKINLFASGDMQCKEAEQAYSAGNYVRAALYFQAAISIYKRISN